MSSVWSFLPLFLPLVVAVPHVPHESLATGFSAAVPMPMLSAPAPISSYAPFFLLLVSFFPKPPQSSASTDAVLLLSSSSVPESPKSKPVVVVFFLFFSPPPWEDHASFSPPSAEVSFVPLVISAVSVVPASVVPKPHLLVVFQLLPQPPNPKPEPGSLVAVSPKLRSSWGVSRFISSKVPVEGFFAVVGSGSP